MTEKKMMLYGGIVLMIAFAYLFFRGVKGAASDVVVGAANVAAGAVEGVGTVVGIPTTSTSACDDAIARGSKWDASFACSASRFLTFLRDGK